MTDLEKAIELARKHEGLFGIRNREECCVSACQEMAEWKDKQLIKKAAEWLEEKASSYMSIYWEQGGYATPEYDIDKMINDFKQAMEE